MGQETSIQHLLTIYAPSNVQGPRKKGTLSAAILHSNKEMKTMEFPTQEPWLDLRFLLPNPPTLLLRQNFWNSLQFLFIKILDPTCLARNMHVAQWLPIFPETGELTGNVRRLQASNSCLTTPSKSTTERAEMFYWQKSHQNGWFSLLYEGT